MLLESGLLKVFGLKPYYLLLYIQNHVFTRPILKKAPSKLWKRRNPNITYFQVFGSKCYILNDKDKLSKFNAKADKEIFLGYSLTSKSYRDYNTRI